MGNNWSGLLPAGYSGPDGQHGLHDWALALWADLPQRLDLVRLTPENVKIRGAEASGESRTGAETEAVNTKAA